MRKIKSSLKKKYFVPVVRGQLNKLLKMARIDCDFKQLEVSKELGLANAQYLSNIERGLCAPSMETVLALAKIYKIVPNKIIDVMISDYNQALEQKIRSINKNFK